MTAPDDRREEEIFEEYKTRRASGEDVSPGEYLDQHPEFSDGLKRLFDSIGDEDEPERALPRPLDSLHDAEAAGRVVGDFKIVRKIGAGGMGSVFEAEQISLKRKVALKLLQPHLTLSEKSILKFRREAEAGSRQRHHGIVAIHAVGEQDGVHYIAQELVEGGRTLHDRLEELRAGEPLPKGYFRDVAGLIVEAADALEHAHGVQVIHRDVKPSNILLTPEKRVKVTDFGLARVEDALSLSRTGELAGTPYYMSPEQATGDRRAVGYRTDIYSLGVTLYEALTLKHPFEGKSSHEIIRRITVEDPRDPCRVNPRVPRDLAVICLKAMEKEQGRRYQSMRDFAEDLGRFLDGDVILAKPAGTLTRTMKRIKRNPVVSGAVGVALLATVVLLVYGVWSYFLILDERNRVKTERDEKVKALNRSEAVRLAAQSSLAVDSNPGLALLLAMESVRREPSLFGNNKLLDALRMCSERKTFVHSDLLSSASFSPDGDRVLTASGQSAVHVLNAETGERILTLTTPVNLALFSPDGDHIITSTPENSGTASVWDVATGEKRYTIDGRICRISTLVFSPDGRTLVTVLPHEHRAAIWDIESGEKVALLVGHAGQVHHAVFSPNGRMVVTASHDGTARIWNAADGRVAAVLEGHADRIKTAFFSPDGRRVVTAMGELKERKGEYGFNTQNVQVFDAITGEKQLVLAGHEDGVNIAAFSPDGSKILTASDDLSAKIWDAKTGKVVHDLLSHTGSVISACFSPNGEQAVTASLDDTAIIWDVESGTIVRKLRGHEGYLSNAFFSYDGDKVLTMSKRDQTARLWDATADGSIMTLHARDDYLNAACFSPDGRRIVTAGGAFDFDEIPSTFLDLFLPKYSKHSAQLWDAESGEPLQILSGTKGPVFQACFSPDCRRLITCGFLASCVWNTDTGEKEYTIRGLEGCNFSPRFHENSNTVITAGFLFTSPFRIFTSADLTARLWDMENKKLIRTFSGHEARVWAVDMSPDGSRVVTGSEDETVMIWEGATGKELARLKGPERISRLRLSPDSKTFAVGFMDGTVWICDADEAVVLQEFKEHLENVMGLEFSPDSRWLMTYTTQDTVVRIRDFLLEQGSMVLNGHDDRVWCAAFSPDSDRVVTASQDGTARLWDRSTGKEMLVYRGHSASVNTAYFSPDGTRIVTASADGTAKIWPVDLFAAARRLKPREFTFEEKEKFNLWTEEEEGARVLVATMAEQLPFAADVITRIEADTSLNGSMRGAALYFAGRMSDDPYQMEEAAWAVVRERGMSPEDYKAAYRRATAAHRITPDNDTIRATLGIAGYRAGLMQETIENLTMQFNRYKPLFKNPGTLKEGELRRVAGTVAFIAMAQHRMGNHEEAGRYLDRLRTMMSIPPWADDNRCRSFLDEADALIGIK